MGPGGDTVADEDPTVCPTTAVVAWPVLSSRSSMSLRAATQSPARGLVTKEFLIGPIDRRGVTHSVNKSLDDPSHVLQAGVATDRSNRRARRLGSTDKAPHKNLT